MLLTALTKARGVSGCENEIRCLLKTLAEERGAVCTIDRIGNLIAVKDGQQADAPTVLLAAHMDEVGLITTDATQEGLICFEPVGGIDPRILPSSSVECGEHRIPGIVGLKSPGLQNEAERGMVFQYDQLYIDIGCSNREGALRICPRGTYVNFLSDACEFGDGLIVSKALDDRVGCLNLLAALEHGYEGKLICVFTTQEEIGCRGATVASQWINYDLAMILEGTGANDLGTSDHARQVCALGQGVAVSMMDNASLGHKNLRDAVEQIAADRNISWQLKRFSSGGNDAGSFQRSGGAHPSIVLSVPCRYIHSANSVAARSDIEAQGQLTCAVLEEIPSFWPDISGVL